MIPYDAIYIDRTLWSSFGLIVVQYRIIVGYVYKSRCSR